MPLGMCFMARKFLDTTRWTHGQLLKITVHVDENTLTSISTHTIEQQQTGINHSLLGRCAFHLAGGVVLMLLISATFTMAAVNDNII